MIDQCRESTGSHQNGNRDADEKHEQHDFRDGFRVHQDELRQTRFFPNQEKGSDTSCADRYEQRLPKGDDDADRK